MPDSCCAAWVQCEARSSSAARNGSRERKCLRAIPSFALRVRCNRALGGQVVTGFETTLAQLARVNDDTPLVGRTVERVESRGKWCLIFFSGDLILLTHMRMTGTWHIYRVGERWQAPRSAMRIVITCGDVQAVGFSIPVAEFHTARSLERSAHMSELGLDVLGATYRVDEAAQALREYGRAHPDAEIGNVLLNQRVIAGIGNIYKSETRLRRE